MGPPTKEDALDLPVRRRIVEAVDGSPGLHLRGLAQRLDIPLSSLEYHCYHLVRQEGVRRICTHLLLHPGATPKEVREAAGLSPPTLSFHLKKLRMAGLLEEEPAGRTKHLRLVDGERIANVLVTYRRSFVDDVVDRFAKTWLSLR